MPVVTVQEAAHDDATVSYLLSQTLLAEQEAKEVEELEAKLVDREQRLLMSCRELRGRHDLRDQFTRLETQVISWAGIKWEIDKKKGKKRKRKKRRKKHLPRNPLLQGRHVPVFFNDEFQQSKKFEFMVPQDDAWTFPLCSRDRYVVSWYRKLWSFRSCSSSLAVDISFVLQRLFTMVQTVLQIIVTLQLQFVARWSMSLDVHVQKTSEIPQLQFINKGFYIPVVAQWLSPVVQTVLRTTQVLQSLVDKVGAAPCYAGRMSIRACRSSTFLS